MAEPKIETSGYRNGIQPLSEGYVRKGGLNPPMKQTLQRPPAPAPMRTQAPASPAATSKPSGS